MSGQAREHASSEVRLGPARYVAMTVEQEELVVTALAGMLVDVDARRERPTDEPVDDTSAEPGPCP